MRIGIDVMGGDYAPKVTVEGALLAQQELPDDVRIVLIGDEEAIKATLNENNADPSLFDIVPTTEVIGMAEHPTKAFSQKTNSSITVGFHLLKAGKIDAFAGAGNTGAMLVGSFYTVKAVQGVIRPSIATLLPKESGGVNVLLDVGINSDCKSDVLYQFGILGSLYAEHVFGIQNPKVGLINIGEEEGKGNLVTQATHELMKETKEFNFVGNIESRDMFSDKADVMVCDGFTGNIMLKEAEAIYTLIKKRGIEDAYFDRFNYENYGGTPVLGINSTVMIGHGISNDIAIKNMIRSAYEIADAKLSDKIKNAFEV